MLEGHVCEVVGWPPSSEESNSTLLICNSVYTLLTAFVYLWLFPSEQSFPSSRSEFHLSSPSCILSKLKDSDDMFKRMWICATTGLIDLDIGISQWSKSMAHVIHTLEELQNSKPPWMHRISWMSANAMTMKTTRSNRRLILLWILYAIQSNLSGVGEGSESIKKHASATCIAAANSTYTLAEPSSPSL